MSSHKTASSERPEIAATNVVARACAEAFGKPLVANNLRYLLVESMIAGVLAPRWTWVSADWAGWDFEDEKGIRLEVKQSAAKQSWTREGGLSPRCTFDIKPRAGYWKAGDKWIAEPGRNADIYVFAHHPVADASADHRNPHQWRFHIVRQTLLPERQRAISLSSVQRLASAVGIEALAERIDRVAAAVVSECEQTERKNLTE